MLCLWTMHGMWPANKHRSYPRFISPAHRPFFLASVRHIMSSTVTSFESVVHVSVYSSMLIGPLLLRLSWNVFPFYRQMVLTNTLIRL